MYILIAILVFGFLIFIHELGHFLTARMFGVKVNEFSLGMGPKLVTYTSKKSGTVYALSMFPIGGYVSMEGEDNESDDPNSFRGKAAWKRFIIVSAGAVMNLFCGVLAMLILVLNTNLGSTVIYDFVPPEQSGYEISSANSGLLPGDRIIKVGDTKVHILTELNYEVMRNGTEPIEVVVLRDGEEKTLTVTFPTEESGGETFGTLDFRVWGEEKTFGSVIKHTFYYSLSTMKMIWESFFDLLTGRYGFSSVSGPVGAASVVSEAAKVSVLHLLYLVGIISMNLGIFNLFPIPALDGGRLVFLLIEIIFRKPVPEKYEGWVHFAGILLLFGFMILVTIKDVITLIM